MVELHGGTLFFETPLRAGRAFLHSAGAGGAAAVGARRAIRLPAEPGAPGRVHSQPLGPALHPSGWPAGAARHASCSCATRASRSTGIACLAGSTMIVELLHTCSSWSAASTPGGSWRSLTLWPRDGRTRASWSRPWSRFSPGWLSAISFAALRTPRRISSRPSWALIEHDRLASGLDLFPAAHAQGRSRHEKFPWSDSLAASRRMGFSRRSAAFSASAAADRLVSGLGLGCPRSRVPMTSERRIPTLSASSRPDGSLPLVGGVG